MATVRARLKSSRMTYLLIGIGSLLDISGQATLDHGRRDVNEVRMRTDREALASDWANIGGDWQRALQRVNARD